MVAGVASFAVDLVWSGHDGADYVDVEYQVDGGVWNQIPNLFGGGTHTIDYGSSGNNGNATINQGGILGNVLSVRVCVDTNTSAEGTTVDNLSVPQAGAMILPVTWGPVDVKHIRSQNHVSWSTYTEINNDRFEVERRSASQQEWVAVGAVDASGDSDMMSSYSFIDDDISADANYYRIKQVDLDGRFDYSPVVHTRSDVEQEVGIFPNPTSDQITIRQNASADSGTPYQIYDVLGNLVDVTFERLTDTSIKADLTLLKTGVYFLQLPNGESRRISKY